MKTSDATVSVKIGDKEFSKAYSKVEAENSDDILKLLGTPDSAKEVIRLYNYGQDLKVRATVRQAILQENEGPDKAIAKLAADIVKMYAGAGRTITPEKALEKAKAQFAAMEADDTATTA